MSVVVRVCVGVEGVCFCECLLDLEVFGVEQYMSLKGSQAGSVRRSVPGRAAKSVSHAIFKSVRSELIKGATLWLEYVVCSM